LSATSPSQITATISKLIEEGNMKQEPFGFIATNLFLS